MVKRATRFSADSHSIMGSIPTISVIDYQLPLDEFLERSVRAKRQVVFVDDVTGSESSTIHQSIVFPVRNSGKEKIATVVLGRNIFSNLEVFEEQYEVRAAVVTPDYDLSLENYVQVQEGEFEIYDLPGLVARAKKLLKSATVGCLRRTQLIRAHQ